MGEMERVGKPVVEGRSRPEVAVREGKDRRIRLIRVL